jgi:hypothetical protein
VPCDELVETRNGIMWRGVVLFNDAQVKASQDQFCHVCAKEQKGSSILPYLPLCAFIQPSSRRVSGSRQTGRPLEPAIVGVRLSRIFVKMRWLSRRRGCRKESPIDGQSPVSHAQKREDCNERQDVFADRAVAGRA